MKERCKWPPAARLYGPLLAAALPLLAACPESRTALLDITASSGIDTRHDNGMSGEFYFAEMMGAGAAAFDYDGDGDQDILLTQGGPVMHEASPATLHKLFRNDGPDAVPQFADVSEQAGLATASYTMGVAIGDTNNDGHPDVYLTAFGANSLWLNRGNGQFEDVTATAGVGDDRWGVSASFLDYDGDGLLDLYVGNYVDYRRANHKPCRSTTSRRDYCSPKVYRPQIDRLYRNSGNNAAGVPVFADVSREAGIDRAAGGALGVITADFDGDGLLDIYVANDGVANILWRNRGDGRFENSAAFAGVAVNMSGAPEASMGVDADDYDGDGDIDLFMTHLNRESNTLYVNDGSGLFDDRSAVAGLADSSLKFTGFGTRWFDVDGDGDLDIFSANGGVTQIEELLAAGDPFALGQSNQLFENHDGRYADVSVRMGAALEPLEVSRGLAVADFDDDGDLDLLIANNNDSPRLLRNESDPARWIGIAPIDAATGRSAVGALVTLANVDGAPTRRSRRDGSYASSSDPRVILPLARRAGSTQDIVVRWPDGREQHFAGLAVNRYHRISSERSE